MFIIFLSFNSKKQAKIYFLTKNLRNKVIFYFNDFAMYKDIVKNHFFKRIIIFAAVIKKGKASL